MKQQDKGRGNANEEGRVQEDAKRKEKGKNKPQGPTVVAVVEEEEEEEEVKEWIPIQHVHHKPTPRALHHLERRVQYQPLVESNVPIHGGHGGGGGGGDNDVDGGGSSNRHGRVNQAQRQGSGRVRVLDPSMVPPLHQPREGEFVHQMGIQRQILRYRSMLSPSSSREGDKGHGWEDEFSLRNGATSPDGTGAGGVTERSNNDEDEDDDGLIATDSEGEGEEEEEEKDVLPPTHRQRATPRGGIFNIIACAWD